MKKSFYKGLKVRKFAAIIMAVCCILTISIFYTSFKMKKKHNNLVDIMNDYAICSDAISDLRISSSRLSYYAICFLENCDFDYLNRYFYELNVLGLQDRAYKLINLSHKNDSIAINTQLAYRESQVLINVEIYAMRLMCHGLGIDESILPEEIKNIELRQSHLKLSPEEQIAAARELIFNDLHMHSRDLTKTYSEIAAGSLISFFRSSQMESNDFIQKKFVIQFSLLITLSILCIILYIILVFFVFIPLHRHLIAIQKNDKMKESGSFEVRYIAKAYNALSDKNAMDASVLKHKAEHDPLTGLINREAFNQIMSVLSSVQEPVAYLIVDIDLFKGINDKYGHTTGDKVLVKIAHLLNDQFRATDYIARIGGDEFAVIMTKFGTAPVMDIVRRKINGLNKLLQEEDEEVPPVSLSVGVAVSDMGFKTSLIENADKALYRVKRAGRCNCFFYGAE